MSVWKKLFLPTYFTIRFIFATFIDLTALFDIIHRFYCIILVNFYFHLQYFQQKNFNFNKISESPIDPKCMFGKNYFCQFILLFSLFLLLFMGPTALFDTIHGSFIILFQLIITFIYYTFSKKFLISTK